MLHVMLRLSPLLSPGHLSEVEKYLMHVIYIHLVYVYSYASRSHKYLQLQSNHHRILHSFVLFYFGILSLSLTVGYLAPNYP